MKRILITLLILTLIKPAFAADLNITLTDNYLDDTDYANATILIEQNINAVGNINNIMTRGTVENLGLTNNGNLTNGDNANIYIQGATKNAIVTNNGSLTTNNYENIYFEGAGAEFGESTISIINNADATITSDASNIRAVSFIGRDQNQEEFYYNYDFELTNHGYIHSTDTLANHSISIELNEDRTNNATIINSGQNARIVSDNQKAIYVDSANVFTLHNTIAGNLTLETSNTRIEGESSAVSVTANSYNILNSASIISSSAESTIAITQITDGGSINNAGEIINNSSGAAIYSDGAGDVDITNSGLISSTGANAIYVTGADNFTLHILDGSIINSDVYAAVLSGGTLNLDIQDSLTGEEFSALADQIASFELYNVSLAESKTLEVNSLEELGTISVSGSLNNFGQISTLDLNNGDVINSGTIGNFNFDINNNGSTVSFRNNSTTNFLNINGANNQINLYQGSTIGAINNNSNTIYNLVDGNYEFSDNLNGAGNITLSGNYMVTISGNSNLTGSLIANNRELKINGSTAGNVIINNGATLSGNGSMQNLTLNAGATVAPGNSVGTLNVASITYNSSSISDFEFNRQAIDKINSTNDANIDGTLNLTLYQDNGDFVVAQNIIETDVGDVLGEFSQVNIDDNYVLNLQYNQKSVSAVIASKVNSNILDSQIFLQNNIVNLVANNVQNQLQKTNIEEGKFSSWINIEGFDNKRQNLENSRSFKTNGQLVSAGFIFGGESIDFATTIFSSFSKINRGYYLGKENINSNGISFTLSKKYQNFSNYVEFGGGILNGDFAREVLINNQMQNSKAKVSGDFGYVTLGANYNLNKNIGFRGGATIQRTKINNINESGLTYSNLTISENKANSLNFEIANFYQGNFNLSNNLFKETGYQFEISANHNQLINSKNVTITQEGNSYNLPLQYNQGFIFALGAEINSRLSENLLLSLKLKRKQNNNFYENNASFNLKLSF